MLDTSTVIRLSAIRAPTVLPAELLITAATLRRAGRKTAARAYDAMIAATAIANELPVYTCNPDDFAGIEGLEVVSVPTA